MEIPSQDQELQALLIWHRKRILSAFCATLRIIC